MLRPYYRILKHDPDGRLVKDTGLIESHSYVIQFLELIEAHLDTKSKSCTDVEGANTRIMLTAFANSRFGRADSGVGVDTYGIVVGTNAGVTAEDTENYVLDTKILHSAVGAAGKLNYQSVTFVKAREVGANVDLDVSRTFLNETGNTITVKEIGMICANLEVGLYHLLLRDVVTSEDVPDGYTLTVVYVMRTTV